MPIISDQIFTLVFSVGSFVLLWLGIVYLVSFMSGWNALAKHFPDIDTGVMGEKKSWQSIRLGMSNYSGIIFAEALPQGLRLKVMPLFKIGHKDMLIPWQEIVIEDAMKGFLKIKKITFQSMPGKYFYALGKFGGWIEENKNKYY